MRFSWFSLKVWATVEVWDLAEALIDGMSFSTEQIGLLKKTKRCWFHVQSHKWPTNAQLKSIGFPIGAIIELKAMAERNRIATPKSIPASSGDSTPLTWSTSCSSKSPVTHKMTLEKLREAVGHLGAKADDTERKRLIPFVCDKLFDVSSMRKILIRFGESVASWI